MSSPIAPAITPMAIFDEHQWVILIQKILEDNSEEEDIPVCIFNVPKPLITYNPQFYIPQMVSIGPCHHFRNEVREMGRYKLAAAKRTQKRLENHKFNSLVEELTKMEREIRGCYHMHLDFNGETLAWMMAVDLSFLLEVFQAQVNSVKKAQAQGTSVEKGLDVLPAQDTSVKKGLEVLEAQDTSVEKGVEILPAQDISVKEDKSLKRMSHLVDSSGEKSTHNAILRDIIMLENQVPLFVLRKLLEFEHSSLVLVDEVLSSMLCTICRELSPFNVKNIPNPSSIEIPGISHLLGFLYQTSISKTDVTKIGAPGGKSVKEEVVPPKSGYTKQFFVEIWLRLGNLNLGQVKESGSFKVVVKLPWTIISKLPGFSNIALTLENIFFPNGKEERKPEDSSSPSVEEIMIPSVTELYNAGVRFVPSDGNVGCVSFDTNTGVFLLPVVSLDVNTEVVLRNLVAYEASMHRGPLIFTRYTELMNGIIDTAEDAKLLREKGVILNYLKSDGEVADIWNGMSRSVRLTRVDDMDGVIKDVNKFYSGRWKIKVRNFFRVYVFGSWQFLAFLAGICIILLMTLQAFCSVYTCSRIFRISSNVIPS